MPANTEPIFPLTGVIGLAKISTANANRDGTGTIVDLVTGGTNGTIIYKIRAKSEVTTTSGMVRIFYHDGTSWELFYEFQVTAITVASSTKSWQEEFVFDVPFVIPSGKKLGAAPHNAEAFNVFAIGGDY